ncbi:hypothetical protein RM190_04975 [Paracoccus sp. CPCC 101403]|uniref:Uncharacterized protein n=1 Tax=Paracoccus broussonetiae TaxID=3075834 RepID=A0ABU3EAF6_9RHOB|nr:hypothetical protein [Paracoccus sp. CPCC 101403]MDT1061202.1 hypothetical protein [Paracoccus sp. CPCC 101403]
MRPVDTLPPLNLWTHDDTQQSWRYLEAQTPVDFTQTLNGVGYAGEILLLVCGQTKYRYALTLDADGYISVTIPAADSKVLKTCRRIDASFQITITAPVPELSLIWSGPVVVTEVAQ